MSLRLSCADSCCGYRDLVGILNNYFLIGCIPETLNGVVVFLMIFTTMAVSLSASQPHSESGALLPLEF